MEYVATTRRRGIAYAIVIQAGATAAQESPQPTPSDPAMRVLASAIIDRRTATGIITRIGVAVHATLTTSTMTTAEKIKIDKLWEFQLYEQGNFGDPKPVGEIVRDIDPHGYYGEDTVVLNREKRYAVKRREIVLDDQGYPTYGAWDWASEWKNVVFEKPLRSIRFRMPQWLIKLVRRR